MAARDWNQDDLAARLKIPSGSVSRFVTGTRKPRMEHIAEWCRRLQLVGDDAIALERAAALERAPEVLRQMIQDLEKARRSDEAKLVEMSAELRALKDVIAQSLQGR